MELSVVDASKSGDDELIHTSFVQNIFTENEQFIERENNLIVFKRMVFELVDIDCKSEAPLRLSVNILMNENLPRKPKDYNGRAKWKKSNLSNGNPRQYMVAQISINNHEFYLIEIEKNDKEDAISTRSVIRKVGFYIKVFFIK